MDTNCKVVSNELLFLRRTSGRTCVQQSVSQLSDLLNWDYDADAPLRWRADFRGQIDGDVEFDFDSESIDGNFTAHVAASGNIDHIKYCPFCG